MVLGCFFPMSSRAGIATVGIDTGIDDSTGSGIGTRSAKLLTRTGLLPARCLRTTRSPMIAAEVWCQPAQLVDWPSGLTGFTSVALIGVTVGVSCRRDSGECDRLTAEVDPLWTNRGACRPGVMTAGESAKEKNLRPCRDFGPITMYFWCFISSNGRRVKRSGCRSCAQQRTSGSRPTTAPPRGRCCRPSPENPRCSATEKKTP